MRFLYFARFYSYLFYLNSKYYFWAFLGLFLPLIITMLFSGSIVFSLLFLFNTFVFPLVTSIFLLSFVIFLSAVLAIGLALAASFLVIKFTPIKEFYQTIIEDFFRYKENEALKSISSVYNHVSSFDGGVYYLKTENFDDLKSLPLFVTEIVFQKTLRASAHSSNKFSEVQLKRIIELLPNHITHLHFPHADLSEYSSIHEQARAESLIKENAIPVSIMPHDVLDEFVMSFTSNLYSTSASQEDQVDQDCPKMNSRLANVRKNQEGERSRGLTFFTITNGSAFFARERVNPMKTEVLTEVTKDTQTILACRYR